MGQGIMQAQVSVIQEIMQISDLAAVDKEQLKVKLLLPNQYQVDELRQSTLAKHNGYVYVLLSAPEIPDGATVTPNYRSVLQEDGRYIPELERIEIGA